MITELASACGRINVCWHCLAPRTSRHTSSHVRQQVETHKYITGWLCTFCTRLSHANNKIT